MKKIVISLLLLWSGGLFAANDFPPLFKTEYKLYAKGILVGKGTRELSFLQENIFQFESIGETTGLIALFKNIRLEERTIFTQTTGKIRPLEYVYNQTGSKKRYSHIWFDWPKQIAINLYKGEKLKVPLQEGILDTLLYQVVLMQELKQGKRQLEYNVVHKGKITTYKPTFYGKVRIETGVGELETLKYEHVSSNKKRRTTLWCAPNLHYVPVQVEHVEKNGDVFRMVLQSVQGLD